MKKIFEENRENIGFIAVIAIILTLSVTGVLYIANEPEPEPEPLVILDEFNIESIRFHTSNDFLAKKKMTVETETMTVVVYFEQTDIIHDGDTGKVRLVEYDNDNAIMEPRWRLFIPKDQLKSISKQYTDEYGMTIPIEQPG